MATTCFLICAIGESGTETRDNADALLEELATALEPYDMRAMRGDHNVDSKEVDTDVIERVQNSELCVADLSEDNINVYYELGRRDETGKPIILIKRKGSGNLPVDISGRRFIEYELDTRRGARAFREELRKMVEVEAQHGFEGTNGDATLAGVLEVIKRVERKVDRLGKGHTATGTGVGGDTGGDGGQTGSLPKNVDPQDAFNLALRTRNVPLGEAAMDRLQYVMETNHFYDIVVEQLASMGSRRAGQMLIDYAEVFFDSDMSFKKKVEYLGCLVGSANRYDRELEIEDLVKRITVDLAAEAEQAGDAVDPEDLVQVYNQQNRLCYGIYVNTRDTAYLRKAIDALHKALRIFEAPYLYYNLAICERGVDLPAAREAIDRCLALSKDSEDDDHLELACRIYHQMGDPGFDDLFERLQQVNPYKAQLIDFDD